MKLQDGTRILFIGDSITDCGRDRSGVIDVDGHLGGGYVLQVKSLLGAHYPERAVEVLNTGCGGHRITDLAGRWESDVLALKPDWLTVMIGINDVWRQFDRPFIEQVTPEGLRGHSLRPLFDGSADSVREDSFAEVTYHAAYQPMRSVRTKRWNYVRSFDNERRRPLANCDASRSRDVLVAAGYGDRPTAEEALYDLLFDPQERNNLAGDPAHADILKQMRKRLDRWLLETADPLLAGPVVLPKGATVNTRESVDPAEGPFISGE